MDKWLAEVVTVGGLTGTRRDYIAHLTSECGWTLDEAVKIACHAKAVR
jgi:hypothetical protein